MPAKKDLKQDEKEKKRKAQKTTQKEEKDPDKKKRKKARQESFSIYLYKVLKQVHPEIGVSKKSMNILNSFINDIFEKLMIEASKLVRYAKKRTLSSREV